MSKTTIKKHERNIIILYPDPFLSMYLPSSLIITKRRGLKVICDVIKLTTDVTNYTALATPTFAGHLGWGSLLHMHNAQLLQHDAADNGSGSCSGNCRQGVLCVSG